MLPGLKTCLYNMDCLDALKLLPSQSVDSLITDPPAGISFMGKDWDSDLGGSKEWIEWMFQVARQCRRVMRPGAHGLVWAIPRTSHWTATALEQAGFEIRDVVTHVFGSGFPKSLDISKAIDKAAGAEREVLRTHIQSIQDRKPGNALEGSKDTSLAWQYDVTAPATEAAKQWAGWGTALKPASEHWILIRKSLAVKNVASNVLKHGTGGINVDQSRIGLQPGEVTHGSGANQGGTIYSGEGSGFNATRTGVPNIKSTQGRFPANFVLSHNDDCDETCTPGCAVAELDRQSGTSGGDKRAVKKGGTAPAGNGQTHGAMGVVPVSTCYQDTGGASRFFYCAKTSKRERNEGLDGFAAKEVRRHGDRAPDVGRQPQVALIEKNNHPTVKPQRLMEYLIRMVTPVGGTVLDPFMGSGSTGVAAKRLGFKFIGIEREKEYFSIARARVCRGKDL